MRQRLCAMGMEKFVKGPFDITVVKFSTVQGIPKNIDK